MRILDRSNLSRFLFLSLVATVVALFAVGCGGSRDNFVATNTNNVQTGTLTFNFAVTQGVFNVPAGTTDIVFTFFDQNGQAGSVTFTVTRNFALQIAVAGVPTTTRSYRLVARNANGTELATGTGNVVVVANANTTVDGTTGLVILTPPAATPLNVFVSNNDAAAGDDGQIDFFDRINTFVRTFTSVASGNQGIALDALGTGFHNGDTVVHFLSTLHERTGNFNTNFDRTFTVTGSTNIKGSALVQNSGFLALADFGGSRIIVIGTAATNGNVITSQATTAAPWDMAYDRVADRLFVAFTDGSIGVYDTFSVDIDGSVFTGAPDRTINPTGLDNAHGIAYDSATDLLIVSDVGAVTAGPNTDGEIYVIANASTATGTVTAQAIIAGNNTQLGNPVDIDLQGADLRVAEKTNDQILIFTNILTTTGGNLVPNVATAETKPESITSRVTAPFNPDNSDIDGGVAVQNIFVATNSSDAAGTAAGALNVLMRIDPALTTIRNTFNSSQGGVGESAKVDSQGDVFYTIDGTNLGHYGRLAGNQRPGLVFDAILDNIRGGLAQLAGSKGLDIVDSRGVVIIADNGNSQVHVIGKYGNGTSIFTTATAAAPWDVDYDPTNDRLYVALTDGRVEVYDTYLNGPNPNTATPNRTITVTGATNLHGIVHDAVNDVLLLSDVGAVTMGANTDGSLYVVNNASTANGATAAAVTIAGGNTLLGNPVDVAYDGTNLYVAEKTQNRVMRFDSIRTSPGGDIAPNAQITIENPESVSLITNL